MSNERSEREIRTRPRGAGMPELTKMLDTGTQTLLLREAYDAHCRCGRSLTWATSKDPSTTGESECMCGMAYTAWLPTVKIEGIDRSTL